MNNLDYQIELKRILDILRNADNRAKRMAESTQNPSQSSLDANADDINAARVRIAGLIDD